MKKTFYTLGFALFALAACQSEEQAFLQSLDDAQGIGTAKEKVLTSFTAEFANSTDTRTQLVDGEKVRWTAGDKIEVFAADGGIETGYYKSTFSTIEDGYSVAMKGSIPETTDYYALYPSSAATDGYYPISGSQKAFGLTIPAQQIAMPNTFAENLNLGYAHSTTQNLSFKNVNALIKFQLTGSAVSNLSKVKIFPTASMGSTPLLSGEILIDTNNGDFLSINGEGSNVELTGDFVGNTSYYMVTAPASMPNGFSLTFVDKDGKEYSKYATNGVDLKQGDILNLGEITLESSNFVSNGEPTVYHQSSKSKAVPLVVIAEGFTNSELAKFNQQATRMLDFFFSVEPYKTYKDYFNVYILPAVSEESGADILDKGSPVLKNTYFNAGWGSDNYDNMTADGDKVFSFVKEHCPDIKNGLAKITETPIIMIVNDSRYGGICRSTSDGSGFAIIPTTNKSGNEVISWSGNKGATGGMTNYGTWINTALHEGGGHCFGRLADEYWANNAYPGTTIPEHSWEVPFSLNVTADKNNPLWKDMIPSSPGAVETGKFPHVGLYEGGNAKYNEGIWRSERISIMDDNRAYFSAWQRYLIVQRIFSIVGETLTYEMFLENDKQYKDIQNGVANAGTEGLLTTVYDGLTPNYNYAGAPANYVEKQPEAYPPLPPPVMHEVKKLDIKPVTLYY